MPECVTDDIEISSDNSCRENSDYSDEENSNLKGIKIFLKKKKIKIDPQKVSKFFWRGKWNKWQYYRERNKNLSEDQKQRLVGYRRNYYITHKK